MWSLENASPERLRVLARAIDERGLWQGLLSPQEHQLFVVALDHANPETWSRFLAGKTPLRLRVRNGEGEDHEREVDAVTLAFRVRFMLWESMLDETSNLPTNAEPKEPVNERETGEKSDNDDDYDDDYDDDDNGDAAEEVDPLEVIVAETDQPMDEIDPNVGIWALKHGARMYDTFEEDPDCLVKQSGDDLDNFAKFFDGKESGQDYTKDNDSEKSEKRESGAPKQKDTAENSNTLDFTLRGLAKTAQFGSANLCLKNLLTTIEQKRNNLNVTDLELRNLISDVRKNRSKWASEDKVGQEELYEACEKVVMDLRNTPESAAPFLNKVSKREAPNYYDVIKEPMDLSTVLRKLRAFQYNSKQDFVRDLDLIWSNCLTYNSDPAHFLRKHAIAMRKKTEALAPLIPDITIRSRAEVEAEAEIIERRRNEQKRKREEDEADDEHTADNKRQRDGEEHTENVGSVLEEVNKSGEHEAQSEEEKGKSQSENSEEVSPEEGISEQETRGNEQENLEEQNSEEEKSENEKPQAEQSNGSELKDEQAGSEAIDMENATEAKDDGGLKNLNVPDMESTLWASATRKKRQEYVAARKALFALNKLQMEAPLSIRSPTKMLRFEQALRGEKKKETASNRRTNSPLASAGGLLSSSSDTEPFLFEYDLTSGVPGDLQNDTSSWLSAPVPRAQDLPPSRYLARGELNKLVNRNLNEMQMIRRLIAKILYIRDLQSGQIPMDSYGLPGGGPPITEAFDNVSDPEEDISSRLPGAAPIDSAAAQSSMRRSVAKLFMQAGFEATAPRALDCVTAIAGDYMAKLGETLVANLEAPDSTASFSSVVSGSLEAMGVSKPSQLTRYMSDDVLRQGRRLAVFRSRLNSALVDILRPEVDRYNDEQFQENSDQFVFGQFSNELGEDYFGFRELGLDKELSVASIAVPFHLLQQRIAGDAGGQSTATTNVHGKHKFPKYQPLTPQKIAKLPPLFRGAFWRILDKPLGLPYTRVVEDTALSGLVHQGPPDAHAEMVAQVSEIAGKKPETKQSRDVARQLAQKREQGGSDEDVAAEADTIRQEFLDRMYAQAAAARQKLPGNNKLVARKRRFDTAFVLVKTEKKDTNMAPPQDESEGEISDNMIDFGLNGDMDKEEPSDKDDVGSLAFDDETNGFSFEDNLPTGSLMIQGNDEDDEEDVNDDMGFDLK